MKHSIFIIALLFGLMAFPSCVAILSRAKQPVNISSELPGAKIYMAGNPVASPRVHVPKVPGVMEFRVQKEGYLDRSYTISSSKANPLRYLNVLWLPTIFGLVLAPLDLWNPKVYQYKSQYIIPANEPEPPKRQENEKYLIVKETSFDMPKNAIVEKKFTYEDKYMASKPGMMKRYVESDQNLFDLDELAHFQKNFLHTYQYRDTSQKLFSSYGNSLFINTKIKDLVFNTVNPRLFVTQHAISSPKINADMKVEYEILDYYGQSMLKKEFSVTTDFFALDMEKLNSRMSADSIGSGHSRTVQNGLAISMSRLLHSQEFRSLLPKSEEKNRNEAIEISRPAVLTSRLNDLVKAAVTIQNGPSHGSGFIISESGYIITNFHVVSNEDNGKLSVILNDGTVLPAAIVRYSTRSDLALLKIERTGLPCMTLQDESKEAEIGISVSTIGTPNSLELGQSVAKGIVSGFRRGDNISYNQTDMSLNAGNSGGAMITKEGHVMGVVTLKMMGAGVQGIGFGTPASYIYSDLNIKYK